MSGAKHEWFLVEFIHASWTECTCGFRPQDETEFYAHPQENET